jgi:hypothetical protein
LQKIFKECKDLPLLENPIKEHEQLCQQKCEIETRIAQLNGKYYQDPTSLLDQAYQKSASDSINRKEFDDLLTERQHLQKKLAQVTEALNNTSPSIRQYISMEPSTRENFSLSSLELEQHVKMTCQTSIDHLIKRK